MGRIDSDVRLEATMDAGPAPHFAEHRPVEPPEVLVVDESDWSWSSTQHGDRNVERLGVVEFASGRDETFEIVVADGGVPVPSRHERVTH